LNYPALSVFIFTYFLIVGRKFFKLNVEPWMSMLLGAVLMVLLRVLTVNQATSAINLQVIVFLFGMFCLVVALDQSGALQFAALSLLRMAKTSERLLLAVILSVTVMSAFLVNDAVVLVMTPIVISACRTAKVRSTPYLLSVAFSSNIGSALTPIGNPQNVLIKVVSGIGTGWFILNMLVPVVFSTVVQYYLLKTFFSKQLHAFEEFDTRSIIPKQAIRDQALLERSVAIVTLTVVGFLLSDILNLELALLAVLGGGIVLFIQNRRIEIVRRIDWTVIIFFAGMFVVMEGFSKSGVLELMTPSLIPQFLSTNALVSILWIHFASTILSQLVSNVPLVAMFIPLFRAASAQPRHWLALASGSTLGGNGTLLGAAANVIVLESAEERGESFSFLEFAKVGAVLTAVTVLVSALLVALTTSFLP